MSVIPRALKHFKTSLSRSFYSPPDIEFTPFQKLYFNLQGYNKYGLLRDDLLNPYHPDVIEAVRRLPENVKMDREYRIMRAHLLEVNKSILPKSEWTQLNKEHFYLTPYLSEVQEEKRERTEWEANN